MVDQWLKDATAINGAFVQIKIEVGAGLDRRIDLRPQSFRSGRHIDLIDPRRCLVGQVGPIGVTTGEWLAACCSEKRTLTINKADFHLLAIALQELNGPDIHTIYGSAISKFPRQLFGRS